MSDSPWVSGEKYHRHSCLCSVLCRRDCWHIDIHKWIAEGMPGSFLHHRKFGSGRSAARSSIKSIDTLVSNRLKCWITPFCKFLFRTIQGKNGLKLSDLCFGKDKKFLICWAAICHALKGSQCTGALISCADSVASVG